MKIIGDMWYCGDDVCSCTRPRILLQKQRGNLMIWEEIRFGNIYSWADKDENKEQWDWLLQNSREMKVDNLKEIEEEYNEIYGE